MRSRDIVKLIMEDKEMTNAQLAKKLGISSGTLWDRLNGKKAKELWVSTLVEMLTVMGYELVAREKGGEKEWIIGGK